NRPIRTSQSDLDLSTRYRFGKYHRVFDDLSSPDQRESRFPRIRRIITRHVGLVRLPLFSIQILDVPEHRSLPGVHRELDRYSSTGLKLLHRKNELQVVTGPDSPDFRAA